jgi:hypothetical protein
MKPKVRDAWIVWQSENDAHCWLVTYEFCGLMVPMTVYAVSQADARTEAFNRLRYLS